MPNPKKRAGEELNRGDLSSSSDCPEFRQSRPLVQKHATAKHKKSIRVPLEKSKPSEFPNLDSQSATNKTTQRKRTKNDGYVAWDSTSSTRSRAGSHDSRKTRAPSNDGMSITYGSLSRDTSPAGHGINLLPLNSALDMLGIGDQLGEIDDITSYLGTLDISSDGTSAETSSDEKAVQKSGEPKRAKSSTNSVGETSNSQGKVEKESYDPQRTKKKKLSSLQGAEKKKISEMTANSLGKEKNLSKSSDIKTSDSQGSKKKLSKKAAGKQPIR